MGIIMISYFTCGTMDVCVGALRGLGYAVTPMIVSLLGACGLRIVWIYSLFRVYRTLECLYLSYPVSWILTTIVHVICFIVLFGRSKKKIMAQAAPAV